MQVKKLLADDDAVSPVIGVILMVAITVILAAVIGAFVLGLDDATDEIPQASFNFDGNAEDDLQVTHRSGDSIQADLVRFGGTSFDPSQNNNNSTWAELSDLDDDDLVRAGETTDPLDVNEGEFLIIFSPEGSSSTHTIAETRVTSS